MIQLPDAVAAVLAEEGVVIDYTFEEQRVWSKPDPRWPWLMTRAPVIEDTITLKIRRFPK